MVKKLAKFGVTVIRWRDGKDCWERWEEIVTFRADPALEHTDAVWTLAEGVVGKKWKKTPKSGWDLCELWMESPHNW